MLTVNQNFTIKKLLEEGSAAQYSDPKKAKEIFFEAQTRAQTLDNHKLNIVAGFNLGTGIGLSFGYIQSLFYLDRFNENRKLTFF